MPMGLEWVGSDLAYGDGQAWPAIGWCMMYGWCMACLVGSWRGAWVGVYKHLYVSGLAIILK